MSKSTILITALAITTLLLSSAAEAHPRGRYYSRHYSHPRFGFYFGTPWYPRNFYPYYYPYYTPQVVPVPVPVDPPVYIERGDPQSEQQLPSGYWYYCNDPEGYYPYVKECPGGWLQVSPTPEK